MSLIIRASLLSNSRSSCRSTDNSQQYLTFGMFLRVWHDISSDKRSSFDSGNIIDGRDCMHGRGNPVVTAGLPPGWHRLREPLYATTPLLRYHCQCRAAPLPAKRTNGPLLSMRFWLKTCTTQATEWCRGVLRLLWAWGWEWMGWIWGGVSSSPLRAEYCLSAYFIFNFWVSKCGVFSETPTPIW